MKTFTKSLQKVIETFTSWIHICSRFKSNFIEKCKKTSREIKRAKRIWQNIMQKNDWDDYKILKNKLDKTMKKIMKKQFRKESIDDCESLDKIWSKCKWARKRTFQKTCISTLYEHFSILHAKIDSIKKVDILLKFFFSSLSTIDLIDIDSYEYTQDLVTKKITLNEILKIITYTTINKTSRDDEITNDILKKTITIIASHFYRIFNVCLKESYCSKHFRDSIIITLKKSKKNHYSTIVSYRSIALLNIMNKIMKLIVVKRINYLIETYNLLSITHMRAKKTISIEHALHYIIERVQTTWNENMMISIMLLNIIVMMQDQKTCSIAQSLSSHRHVIACSFRLILNSDFVLETFLFSSSFVLYIKFRVFSLVITIEQLIILNSIFWHYERFTHTQVNVFMRWKFNLFFVALKNAFFDFNRAHSTRFNRKHSFNSLEQASRQYRSFHWVCRFNQSIESLLLSSQSRHCLLLVLFLVVSIESIHLSLRSRRTHSICLWEASRQVKIFS